MPEDTRIFNFCSFADLGRRMPLRFFLFSLVWFVLTGYDGAGWIIGFPAVLLAACLSLLLSPSPGISISLVGACRFIPFFLRQSTLSGIDVMRRALSPRPVINPGLVSYSTFLPEGAARVFFVNTISLLPGTLSADLHDNRVTVHTIDRDQPIWANMQNLELHIAVLLRVSSVKEKK